MTGAMDITADLGCSRAIDPDLTFNRNPVLDDTMAMGDCRGHLDQCGTNLAKPLDQRGHRLCPKPQISVWSLVATWASDINTDPGSGRCRDYGIIFPE